MKKIFIGLIIIFSSIVFNQAQRANTSCCIPDSTEQYGIYLEIDQAVTLLISFTKELHACNFSENKLDPLIQEILNFLIFIQHDKIVQNRVVCEKETYPIFNNLLHLHTSRSMQDMYNYITTLLQIDKQQIVTEALCLFEMILSDKKNRLFSDIHQIFAQDKTLFRGKKIPISPSAVIECLSFLCGSLARSFPTKTGLSICALLADTAYKIIASYEERRIIKKRVKAGLASIEELAEKDDANLTMAKHDIEKTIAELFDAFKKTKDKKKKNKKRSLLIEHDQDRYEIEYDKYINQIAQLSIELDVAIAERINFLMLSSQTDNRLEKESEKNTV